MIGFFKFIAGTRGRLLQSGLGILFIVGGLFEVDTSLGDLLLVIGLLTLAGGVFDVCFPALLVGLPFEGPKLRKELLRRQLRRPQARPR